MRTGEGKTLVSTCPAYLNALRGKGVQIVTVNDYLAKRDAEWMGQVHRFLGLTVGVVLNEMNSEERKAAYACDITYVTNNELGFDYLRDNMAIYKEQLVLRDLDYCIIDEVDSVLIDEARTPLIISGQSGKSTKLYEVCDVLARQLERGTVSKEFSKIDAIMGEEIEETGDFIVNEKDKIVNLTEQGVTVDETIPALPAASPSQTMPAQLMDCSGYYASTLQQFKVDISADGVLTIQSLTVPSAPAQTFYYFDDGSFRDQTGAAAMVKPVVEDNGETYLWQKAYAFLPGLTVLPTSNYVGQKVEPAQLSADVQAAWDKWNSTSVLPLNEKYTSQVWLSLGSAAAAELPEYIPGYVGAQKIVDANHTQFAVQLPGNGGRDGSDTTITEQDGHIWMDAQGILYVDASIAQPIYCGAGAYSTIQPDG